MYYPKDKPPTEPSGCVWKEYETACGVCFTGDALGTEDGRASLGEYSGSRGSSNRGLEQFRAPADGGMGEGATWDLVASGHGAQWPNNN